MRHLARAGVACAGVATLLALIVGTALAGGWAEATLITQADDPPTAGEEREIRFSLLQHGVTAVEDGHVELTATHPETGETIVVPATSEGGGTWSALVTFAAEGDWQIRVSHQDLETSSPPMNLRIGAADTFAWLPVALAVAGFLAAVAAVAAGILLTRGRAANADAPVPVANAGG